MGTSLNLERATEPRTNLHTRNAGQGLAHRRGSCEKEDRTGWKIVEAEQSNAQCLKGPSEGHGGWLRCSLLYYPLVLAHFPREMIHPIISSGCQVDSLKQ